MLILYLNIQMPLLQEMVRREQMYQEQQQKHALQVAEARRAVVALQQPQPASASPPSRYQARTTACSARITHFLA